MSMLGFQKVAPITVFICVCAMVVSRAPTLVDEFSMLGVKFNINVGYVVIFSIPIIMLLLTWLWIVRDKSIMEKNPYSNNTWILPFLAIFPSLSAFFLYWQFLTEFAPPGECSTFSASQFFWDIDLWEMKPEYCFNLPQEIQNLMPYIYPPIQTWAYLGFVAVCIFLSVKLRQYYSV